MAVITPRGVFLIGERKRILRRKEKIGKIMNELEKRKIWILVHYLL